MNRRRFLATTLAVPLVLPAGTVHAGLGVDPAAGTLATRFRW